MIFANVIMKIRYDKSHKFIKIKLNDNVYLHLHHEYKISDIENRKLTLQRVRSFKILEMILNDLVCKLTLSSIMKIHSIISIAQLKSVFEDQNLYNRVQNDESSFIWKKNNQETLKYEIEWLIYHFTFWDQRQYLIKWREYDNEHNAWYFVDDLKNAVKLVEQYETRHSSQDWICTWERARLS